MILGYMLPLKFIRVSDQMSICATRIVAIMSTKAYQARRLIMQEKRADTLLNACGRGPVNTAIILDNGAVVSSPLTITQLLRNISRADSKSSQGKKVRLSNSLKVFEIMPDEEYEALKEDETPELEAYAEGTEFDQIDLNEEDTDGDEDLSNVLDIAWDGDGDEDDSD